MRPAVRPSLRRRAQRSPAPRALRPRRLGPAAVHRRAASIRMVLMDCDGVLTDGGVVFASGGGEIKRFDSKDGVGMRLAQSLGLEVGIVTGRRSEMVRRRARELGVREVHQKVWDKLALVGRLLRRRRLGFPHLCFIGDDVLDLPVLQRAGLAVAPADAHPEVLRRVHWVTRRRGGRGAVREVLDRLIEARGLGARLRERYFR